jgi:hypothetical protein
MLGLKPKQPMKVGMGIVALIVLKSKFSKEWKM